MKSKNLSSYIYEVYHVFISVYVYVYVLYSMKSILYPVLEATDLTPAAARGVAGTPPPPPGPPAPDCRQAWPRRT